MEHTEQPLLGSDTVRDVVIGMAKSSRTLDLKSGLNEAGNVVPHWAARQAPPLFQVGEYPIERLGRSMRDSRSQCQDSPLQDNAAQVGMHETKRVLTGQVNGMIGAGGPTATAGRLDGGG